MRDLILVNRRARRARRAAGVDRRPDDDFSCVKQCPRRSAGPRRTRRIDVAATPWRRHGGRCGAFAKSGPQVYPVNSWHSECSASQYAESPCDCSGGAARRCTAFANRDPGVIAIDTGAHFFGSGLFFDAFSGAAGLGAAWERRAGAETIRKGDSQIRPRNISRGTAARWSSSRRRTTAAPQTTRGSRGSRRRAAGSHRRRGVAATPRTWIQSSAGIAAPPRLDTPPARRRRILRKLALRRVVPAQRRICERRRRARPRHRPHGRRLSRVADRRRDGAERVAADRDELGRRGRSASRRSRRAVHDCGPRGYPSPAQRGLHASARAVVLPRGRYDKASRRRRGRGVDIRFAARTFR